MSDEPVEFIQSGPSMNKLTLQAKMRERDPYSVHLMQQPYLVDFLPKFERVEDWHIANFLKAQEHWLAEERELRKAWRA